MENLIADIKSKKELKSLDKKIVEEYLEKFFKTNSHLKVKLEAKKFNKKSSEYKLVLKEVRKNLRQIYGVFIEKDYGKREKLLQEMKTLKESEALTKILSLHKSTKERIPYYKEVYSNILAITGKGKIILDLACGLNPLSYGFLGYKPEYIASDIAEKDLEFIDSFFKKFKIKGKTIKIDLVTEQEKLKTIKIDICFLLKALDSLETRKRYISQELIENINSKWLIVSFPKKSLGSAKEISKKKRQWFIKMLENKGFLHHEFEVENEFFLVVKKG